MSIAFELIFFILMCLKFISSYIPEGDTIPVKNHYKIYKNYYKNGFFKTDLITLLPITFIFSNSQT